MYVNILENLLMKNIELLHVLFSLVVLQHVFLLVMNGGDGDVCKCNYVWNLGQSQANVHVACSPPKISFPS